MPEYQSPGVYVEETSSGSKAVEGTSTSITGFLGQTERGPLSPQLVTSFDDFKDTYGEFVDDSYLGHAVNGFFKNGGSKAYIGRITDEPRTAVSRTTLSNRDGDDVLSVEAVGPGEWGSSIAVTISDAPMSSEENTLFNMTVRYWSTDPETVDNPGGADPTPAPDLEEQYEELSGDETSSQFYGKVLEGASDLIEVGREGTGRPENGTTWLELSNEVKTDGGAVADDADSSAEIGLSVSDYEGDATPGQRTGLAAFEEITDISIVCVPDENEVPGLTDAVVAHCENMGDRIAVLQAPQNPGRIQEMETPVDSSYAAYYYPWIEVRNPKTGMKEVVPPGGHVAGIYARTDTETGVHKAPANETIRGAQGLQVGLTKAEQDILNPKGINCIREFGGRGIRLWGARTTSSDPEWKYVNVRRLFLYLKQSIDEGTQWAVFEPNDQDLWARVRQTIDSFLTEVWRDGALMGTTPDEAFYVRCGEETMSQEDIDNGRLICEIGVSPTKPAEFVVFRIGQWTGSS